MIIADASGLLAAFGHDTRGYKEARAAYEDDPGPVILSPFVLAELDYMLMTRAGVDVEIKFLGEVGEGVFKLDEFNQQDVAKAAEVVTQYRDLKIGLADASIVVLAAKYKTARVLTLDQRHFRAMKTLQGKPFTILPADAQIH